MKIVLAGNYQQYAEYVEERLLDPNEVRFIGSESDLEGLPDNVELVYVGTWWDNPIHTSMRLRFLKDRIKGKR